MDHGFVWYQLIPGYHGGADHILGALLVALALGLLALLCFRRFARQEILPSAKFGITTPFEVITETLLALQDSIIGPGSQRYLPLTGSIFIFILSCNLLGLIPGFTAPTSNILTNFACAIVVFVATHYYGVKAMGLQYPKHFLAPLAGFGGLLISVIFTPVEIVSHLFRMLSLSLRLWGNMYADHTVLGIMESLSPFVLPLPFICLGILVSVVQAFIFALLAMIYIALATAHDH